MAVSGFHRRGVDGRIACKIHLVCPKLYDEREGGRGKGQVHEDDDRVGRKRRCGTRFTAMSLSRRGEIKGCALNDGGFGAGTTLLAVASSKPPLR